MKWSELSSLPEQNSRRSNTKLHVSWRYPGLSRKYFRSREGRKPILVGIEPNPGPNSKALVVRKATKKSPAKSMHRIANLAQHPAGRLGAPYRNMMNSALNQLGGRSNPIGRTASTDEFAKYLACLNNPFDCAPARSGVDCALPTGVFSLYSRNVGTTNTSGGQSLIFHPRCWNAMYYTNNVASPYTYSVGVPSFPQTAAVQAIYNKCRVISAGVRIRNLQPSTADQGQIALVVMPSESLVEATGAVPNLNGGSTFTFGIQEALNHPNASIIPFRRGATAIWRPQDPNSFVFTQGLVTPTGLTEIVETAQAVPYFAVTFANTQPSASFEFEFVIHMEGTVGTGYTGVVAVSPTLHSLPSATAMNAVKQMHGPALNKSCFTGSVGGVVENQVLASSSTKSSESALIDRAKKKDGGFDWGKFATDVLSFGASVLPMIL
jgi:hypothetical protein